MTSSEERSSLVEESSSLVLSLLSREDDCGTSQSLSERVRRLSEVALQKGLESSRQALHKWLSQALKGGAGPAHLMVRKRRCTPRFLVIRDSQGVFTADPQCVAKHCAQEWKREWGCDEACSFKQELQSIRALRETHVGEAGEWAPRGHARRASPFHLKRRSVSTNTLSVTLPVSRTTLWSRWGKLFDRALPNWPYRLSHFCSCWFCWARETEEAELSPSYTPLTVSPCVWFQHTSVNGMSNSLVSGILRSRRTQHSEPTLRVLRAPIWPTEKGNM